MNQLEGPQRLVAQMKSMNGTTNGFHIQSQLTVSDLKSSLTFSAFKEFLNKQAESMNLKRFGEFYFNFPESGFIGIVCFQGSHICINSRPKEKLVHFESFFSDRLLNNMNVSEHLYRQSVNFFESAILSESMESV